MLIWNITRTYANVQKRLRSRPMPPKTAPRYWIDNRTTSLPLMARDLGVA